MGLQAKNRKNSHSTRWWLRWAYCVARQIIYIECVKRSRAYPSAFPLTLLRFSANQGYVPAKVELGQYLFESGVAKADKRNGLEYIRQAAKADQPDAQFILGKAFEEGCDVLGRDQRQAAHWLALAADSGHHQARLMLEMIQTNNAEEEESDALREELGVVGETLAEAESV